MNRTRDAWVSAQVWKRGQKVHLVRDSMDDFGFPVTRNHAVCGVQGGYDQAFRILGTGFGQMRSVDLLREAGYRNLGTLGYLICPTCLAAWRRARRGIKPLPGDPEDARPNPTTGVTL